MALWINSNVVARALVSVQSRSRKFPYSIIVIIIIITGATVTASRQMAQGSTRAPGRQASRPAPIAYNILFFLFYFSFPSILLR